MLLLSLIKMYKQLIKQLDCNTVHNPDDTVKHIYTLFYIIYINKVENMKILQKNCVAGLCVFKQQSLIHFYIKNNITSH